MRKLSGSPRRIKWASAFLFSLAAVALLTGCGKVGGLGAGSFPAPADLPADTQVNLRGNDFNGNGIRDEIESATGAMSDDLTTRLRLLTFAWTLQQGIEVAVLGDDAQLARASQMMADETACITTTDSNASLAQNLIDIYQMTADTSLRKDAWSQLRARTAGVTVVPSSTPCAQVDVMATSILSQTRAKLEASKVAKGGNAASVQSSQAPSAASAPSAPSNSPAVSGLK